VTPLRKLMLEELQRRNYSQTTVTAYVKTVEDFAQHFHRAPDQLGPDEIRTYQLYLLNERKQCVRTIRNHIAALRFFFCKTLKRNYPLEEVPYPSAPRRLPIILTQEEAVRLIDSASNLFHRAMLMTLYSTGMRRARTLPSQGRGYRQQAHGPAYPAWHGTATGMCRSVRNCWRPCASTGAGCTRKTICFQGHLLSAVRSDVLHYLARYTHRVAISNHRLVAFADGQVTFRWKDYAHGSKQKLMTVTAEEFLRRFFLHVLPHGFVRIRFFGFLANRRRKSSLPLCQQLLRMAPPHSPDSAQTNSCSSALWRCPRCGGSMLLCRASPFRSSIRYRRNGGIALTALDPSPVPSTPTHAPACILYVCSDRAFHSNPVLSALVFHIYSALSLLPPRSGPIGSALLRASVLCFEDSKSNSNPIAEHCQTWPRPPQTRAPSFKRLYPN
jgi:putative transposase/integrase-like protein